MCSRERFDMNEINSCLKCTLFIVTLMSKPGNFIEVDDIISAPALERLLRIFLRMSRTRYASQNTQVNVMLKAQTFSTRMEHESMWHHGIAVDPGLLGNVTQSRDSASRQSLLDLTSQRFYSLECSVTPIFLSVDHFLS